MKRKALLVLFLGIAVCTQLSALPTVESTPLSNAEMAETVGKGGCSIARGFSAGAGLAAGITALVPGTQSAAIILGLSAAFVAVTVSAIC